MHFSGKEEGDLIKLHDDRGKLVPFDANSLAPKLATTRKPALKLVVLDTCYNMQLARLLESGVRHAVSIHHAIVKGVATGSFAKSYNQLVSGKNLHAAETAHHITVGALKGYPQNLRAPEVDVLERKFNPRYHVPQVVSRSSELDPRTRRY